LKLTEDHGRNHAANVILISKYTRKYLPENHIIRKTWYIDNPVADSFFEIDRRPEPARIFCCCRIRPLKNIVGMIKAFAIIKKEFSQASLYIAGAADDDYFKECEKEIATNNLDSSVHLLGNISIEAVKSQLSKANCLVLSSFQENSPLTIAEAMAAGVPVAASRVGGIPEMVEDGKTGFLIDPYDTNDIRRAVSKILSDDSLIRSMGKRTKEIARERYMASSVAERTMKVYREILNGSS
jgi:glycosyltransferase involved in cell wall biosynthesis